MGNRYTIVGKCSSSSVCYMCMSYGMTCCRCFFVFYINSHFVGCQKGSSCDVGKAPTPLDEQLHMTYAVTV